MVEHADLIDTELLHEPKGIKESNEGDVYISTVDNPSGPWGGEWRHLKVSDLDITKQGLTTPSYSSQASPATVTSSIITTITGSLSTVATLADASKNDQELYTVIQNLLTRLTTLEDTVSKLRTLTGSVSTGLKNLELFEEEE